VPHSESGRSRGRTEPPCTLAFLDSWARSPERGSGTAVAISGLADALGTSSPEAGHSPCRVVRIGVEAILSRHLRPGPLPTRIAYNVGLPLRFDPAPYDAVVGFDFDGCWLRRPRGRSGHARGLRVVSLKGVAADEQRFETGVSHALFGLAATLEGHNVRRADRVLVTSQYCLERAAEAYRVPPERFRIVPEGIDLAPWDRLHATAAQGSDGQEDRRSRAPTILNIARQYRRKDTRTLLAAMIEVEHAIPGAQLRIVGGGPELPRLVRQARRLGLTERGEAVRFLGELPDEQIRRELLAADLFCLPSRQEGFGIVLLEAMAAGTAIVSTTAGAIPEVAPDGEVAVLVKPGDPAALGAALIDLLDDRERRSRLEEAGRRRVRRYAWPRVAAEFLEALGLD